MFCQSARYSDPFLTTYLVLEHLGEQSDFASRPAALSTPSAFPVHTFIFISSLSAAHDYYFRLSANKKTFLGLSARRLIARDSSGTLKPVIVRSHAPPQPHPRRRGWVCVIVSPPQILPPVTLGRQQRCSFPGPCDRTRHVRRHVSLAKRACFTCS